MTKHIVKKVIIFLLTILAITMFFNIKHCYAITDVTEWIEGDWEPTVEDDSELSEKTGIILGVVRVIGIIVSVGTLMVIGIRYMLGSVEEKAQYKQVLIPWCIGAVMVFSITLLPATIYNMIDSMGKYDPDAATNWNSFIDGYDQMLNKSYSSWKSHSTDTVEHFFKKRLDIQRGNLQKKVEKNNKPYDRGRYECVDTIYTYAAANNYNYTRDEITKYFESIIGIVENIKNGTITTDNIDKELTKYTGRSDIKRLRLEYQKRMWEGSEYLYTKLATPVI